MTSFINTIDFEPPSTDKYESLRAKTPSGKQPDKEKMTNTHHVEAVYCPSPAGKLGEYTTLSFMFIYIPNQ
jgi:hypothetical protein